MRIDRKTPRKYPEISGTAKAELRYAVFLRDNWTCKECGEIVLMLSLDDVNPRRAELAHIVSRGAGGKWEMSNLRTLCKKCHTLEHAYGKSFQKPCPKKAALGGEIGSQDVDGDPMQQEH
jgi:5-methylcytosine-specific restriction endonuclease McrA